MIQLSKLDDKVNIAQEGGPVLTVAELKNEIRLNGAKGFNGGHWYTIEMKEWKPNAETMINDYIEHESQDMYEEWEESAAMCINPEVIAEMQAVLDKAFEGDFATVYYTHNEKVLIDVTGSEKLGGSGQ